MVYRETNGQYHLAQNNIITDFPMVRSKTTDDLMFPKIHAQILDSKGRIRLNK